MKIGLVIHGPEVIDSGDAKRILEKLHNNEKRAPIDLAKAWVKSGNLRRSSFFALQAQKQSISSRNSTSRSMPGTGKVVLIDHAAEFVFEMAMGAELAL
jgi:hypothetical protein